MRNLPNTLLSRQEKASLHEGFMNGFVADSCEGQLNIPQILSPFCETPKWCICGTECQKGHIYVVDIRKVYRCEVFSCVFFATKVLRLQFQIIARTRWERKLEPGWPKRTTDSKITFKGVQVASEAKVLNDF